ncbi:MAG: hypothetical protein U9N42_01365 [Campylobacterota bacterium]|nr:hypothetical protein [Campylobacterota bacterium]
MEFKLETVMLFFFVALLIISIWKIYVFLPNKELADDDKNKEATMELERVMEESILALHVEHQELNAMTIFEKMQSNKHLDKKHFWRFNQNRLNQLLELYKVENGLSDLSEIVKKLEQSH